jgi:flagellar hook-basal body protein
LNLDPGLGSTSTFIEPETFASANDLPAEVYVRFNNTTGRWEEYSASPDLNMLELTESQQFDETRQPQWRPLFLDKGELTFDTSGNLVSPLTGVELDNVVIGGSGNSLQIDIDYTGSTQFTGEFSVNAQSQNGQPNGNLVGLDIGDDGLVTASYSNGSQQLKGKIILANFSTPNGLRQLGDSTFLESAESGAAALAEPGSAGVGTIRAGARERANLDLTSELVDLITAQRNFQANAKGLETSTTLTQTIINIRG